MCTFIHPLCVGGGGYKELVAGPTDVLYCNIYLLLQHCRRTWHGLDVAMSGLPTSATDVWQAVRCVQPSAGVVRLRFASPSCEEGDDMTHLTASKRAWLHAAYGRSCPVPTHTVRERTSVVRHRLQHPSSPVWRARARPPVGEPSSYPWVCVSVCSVCLRCEPK